MNHDNDPLLRFVKGDQTLADMVRGCLQRLADGSGGEVLQSAAQDVLTGRVDIHRLARIPVVQDSLAASVRQVLSWRDEVGEEEFRRQALLAQEASQAALRQPPPSTT